MTQVKILFRALQLLQVNGCVCYSTCSLNPVEDEAVVAAAIIQYNNYSSRKQQHRQSQRTSKHHLDHSKSTDEKDITYVELIDCPKFDNVKLRNGVSKWRVAEYQHDHDNSDNSQDDPDVSSDGRQLTKQYLQWYDTYEDAVRRVGNAHDDSTERKNKVATTMNIPTLWPPNDTDHSDIVQSLSKCQRLLPQDQNSGGFFIALIRKCVHDESNSNTNTATTKSRNLH